MREIRLALLEADVNFKVVKQFTVAGQGALPGRRRPGQPRPRPAGGEDRQRGAGRADGRRQPRPRPRRLGPDRDPDGGAPGLGQDDRLREAGQAPRQGRQACALAACDYAAPGGGRAARHGRQARPAPRSTSRAPSATRSRSPSGRWARPAPPAIDVLIVDTAGPPARRRGADGRAGGDPQAHQAARRPPGARRDDRPGRGQRRRGVRRAGRVRRRAADQARRRRPRRRRAVGEGGDRQADPLRVDRREARRARALPPRADGEPRSSAWATCCR